MAVLLGVLVAASFGSGDFLGGQASKRSPTLTVLLVAQGTAVAGAVIVALAVGARVATHDIVFGALAGCVNIVGIGLLYQGLAVAPMGVVAPLTAVSASVLPVAWGLATGERPSVVVIIGVAFAIAAGALISRQPAPGTAPTGQPPANTGVALALGAGACLGTSLIFYLQTSSASGLWPVLAARVAALVLVALALAVVAARHVALPFPDGTGRTFALGAGVLDVTATTLLLLAVRRGLVLVVAPLAALAPAATVVLARFVLDERLHAGQRIGLVLALIGLVLVAAG
jgi:drug/metabolite transporter (DMT)-like permease